MPKQSKQAQAKTAPTKQVKGVVLPEADYEFVLSFLMRLYSEGRYQAGDNLRAIEMLKGARNGQ